jgi:hypothetical protein
MPTPTVAPPNVGGAVDQGNAGAGSGSGGAVGGVEDPAPPHKPGQKPSRLYALKRY